MIYECEQKDEKKAELKIIQWYIRSKAASKNGLSCIMNPIFNVHNQNTYAVHVSVKYGF